ncbi:MAG: RNA-binding transcriptional accessory protein [Gemmatimonadaceae bacterium]|nr:RNA-binding transcriptional accessory protein [Gemmatimonadaceae bacterium]
MEPSQLSQIASAVAAELALPARQVASTLALFAEGNTLPFVARYRKEATGGLDETQLRAIQERSDYLRELGDRRAAIRKSIEEQGKLTPELASRLDAVTTKQELEDLYLPYKPKRRTRATIARERGLEPLADALWDGGVDDRAALAAAEAYVSDERGVPTVDDALTGARDILSERVAEDAGHRGWVRELTRRKGSVSARAATGKEKEVSKFQDYYDYAEPLGTIPSHRVLAIRRGEEEGVLAWTIAAPAEEIIAGLTMRVAHGRRAEQQLRLVAQDAYKRLLAMSIEVELRLELKTRADEEAIAIFGRNLEQLLLAAPAGERLVIGLDPGFRTGVKVAAVSRTGAVLHTDAWMLHQPDRFAASLVRLVTSSGAELIAIGNGTASRETEALVRSTLRDAQLASPPQVVVVSEAGASVYSASELAVAELPGLDVSLRGAVSIARRLQDPLAELVKIDPKSIGVGQYQHDVNQTRLKKRLEEIVVSAVNRVGVEVNTASAALLAYVSGIGPTLAENIVATRDARGGFPSRRALLEVPRLGAKAFEQAAGFLRVRGAVHPLDASAVHPERYALVERIAADLGVPLSALIANEATLASIDLAKYVSDEVGLPTLQDIVAELRRPGRDPRAAFEAPAFREDVTEPKDLREGMQLEGVVTNIVAFGAFVDVGVHQDGLVHVSQLADRYVSDPNQVVTVGQRVKVRVLGVDLQRNRIALTMKSGAAADARPAAAAQRSKSDRRSAPAKPAVPAAKPFTPKPGDIAPNGMRFR